MTAPVPNEPELDAIQKAICCPKVARRCAPGVACLAADQVETFASACAVRELFRQAAAAAGARSGAAT